jgi:DNA-binding NarL/FixJ family response regulator
VLEAPDGAAGLAYIRTHRSSIGLVVVDMLMPHDGILTCLQIRTEAPQLPLLPFTGAAAYAAMAAELGCAPTLFKPASPNTLAAALWQAIRFRPPPLIASPLIAYLQQQAAASERAVQLQRQAVLRVVVLASSEVLRAGLQSSITAAGGAVRIATTSAAILQNGLGSLRVSLLVADSDIEPVAIDIAQMFHLPLLIVARTMVAAYRAAEVAQGVVVEPVSPQTMAESLTAVAAGTEYRDRLLDVLLAQTPLSSTEQAVGQLLLQGLKDDEIAQRMSQQPQTVRAHKTHMYAKLGVRNRNEFVAWVEAERLGRRRA